MNIFGKEYLCTAF